MKPMISTAATIDGPIGTCPSCSRYRLVATPMRPAAAASRYVATRPPNTHGQPNQPSSASMLGAGLMSPGLGCRVTAKDSSSRPPDAHAQASARRPATLSAATASKPAVAPTSGRLRRFGMRCSAKVDYGRGNRQQAKAGAGRNQRWRPDPDHGARGFNAERAGKPGKRRNDEAHQQADHRGACSNASRTSAPRNAVLSPAATRR
jgi:hypothetical protein